MDGTQSYPAPQAPRQGPSGSVSPAASQYIVHPHPQAPAAPPPQPALMNPAAVKVPSDYVRALRRRIWLVLMVAIPLSVASAVYTARQPSVYRAITSITISPPQYDPMLTMLVSSEGNRRDPDSSATYMPNRVAQLKSKGLALRVVNDPAFVLAGGVPGEDAAEELLFNLQTKIILNSNYVVVSLEGTDPTRITKQLTTLLDLFAKLTKDEIDSQNQDISSFAELSLDKLRKGLTKIEEKTLTMLQTTNTIGPGGKNILQGEYETLGSTIIHKRFRLDEAQQQAWVGKLFPRQTNLDPMENHRLGQVERLQESRRKLTAQLQEHRRLVRNFESDPSVKHTATKLNTVLKQLDELTSVPREAATDPSEMLIATMREEIHSAEEAAKTLLGQLRDSMPEHQQFLALQDEREQKLKQISDLETKISKFSMLSRTQKNPIEIKDPVAEPSVPVRPRRSVNIVLGLVVSFGLGIALVCLLEHLDHSVKVPEHLTVGLTLPLLGVVPRIRRTSLTHRGGHLWTPGVPDSVEADAYRNLRASLLGASDRLGPIVTLLVTSAKANEGKSTTALNLAATCARAGERTLLMDIDLRRPSLAEVFEDGRHVGLVDVLRGELPWQRTVVRTDIPNLDFLPTGNTRSIPIEILGTLELRQLLIGLANHYDRVILDGPAVLGLADCRMLGRVVDAAVLVVRSGAHEMRPLQRAKAMLEQSRVVLAGVIFNGLFEDFQNWSSYGPTQAYVTDSYPSRLDSPRRGLGGSETDEHDEAEVAVRSAS